MKMRASHGRHTQATEVTSLKRSDGWCDQEGMCGGHGNIFIKTIDILP